MQKILTLILLFSYVISFVGSNVPWDYAVSIVKITHTHAHSDDHHHNDETSNSETESPQGSTDPHGGTSHSHEVLVGGGHAVFLASNVVLSVVRIDDGQIKFSVSNQSPPKSPALFGIFRPPIV